MKQTMHHLLRWVGLACISTTALAQENEIPAQPTRYEVELIVFRHVDQSRNTPEIPAEGSLVRKSPLTLNRADDADQPFMTTLEAGIMEPRERVPTVDFYLMDLKAEYPDFIPLDDASMELNSVFRRLDNLDAYQPLVHLGWIQTTKSAANAVPYQIHIRDQGRDDVSGSITLYRERYLHLELDLALDPAVDEYGTDVQATGRKQHKLTESRRIREPSSHYFDHPLFGVIARIQKIVVEPPTAENGGASVRNPG